MAVGFMVGQVMTNYRFCWTHQNTETCIVKKNGMEIFLLSAGLINHSFQNATVRLTSTLEEAYVCLS